MALYVCGTIILICSFISVFMFKNKDNIIFALICQALVLCAFAILEKK